MYNFEVEYRPGPKHSNADGMSRCPNPLNCECNTGDFTESLKCGPCKKCTKRARDMQLDHSQKSTGQQIKMVHQEGNRRRRRDITSYLWGMLVAYVGLVFSICKTSFCCQWLEPLQFHLRGSIQKCKKVTNRGSN